MPILAIPVELNTGALKCFNFGWIVSNKFISYGSVFWFGTLSISLDVFGLPHWPPKSYKIETLEDYGNE